MRLDLNLVKRVNAQVNAAASPSDLEQYGKPEYWEDNAVGDCENKVLAKMNLLIKSGVPHDLLDMGICKIDGQTGHCLLIIHDFDQDYVADNLSDTVYEWNEVPERYRWVERTLNGSMNHWVKIPTR